MGGYASSIFEQQARRAQTGNIPGIVPNGQFRPYSEEDDQLNPQQQVDLSGMYQPGLPSSPRVRATTPDQNPSGAPSTNAGMTPTTTPQAPAPAPNSSSFLDRILHEHDDLNAMIKAGPQARPLSKAEKFAGLIAAGTTGWIEGGRYGGNPAAGFQAAQSIYSRPRLEAEQDWQRKMAAQESQINSDVRLKNIQDQEADRVSLAKDRDATANYRNWEQTGGPEKARIQAQDEDRNKKADDLKAAGYSDRDVAEFRATGSLRRLDPQNETELALAAAGGDKKAGDALTLIRQQKIDEIKAARDPQQETRLLVDMRNGDIQMRGQLQTELDKLETDPMARTDKGTQARISGIRKQMAGLDADIQYAQEHMAQRANVPGRPQAPATAPQGNWNPRTGRYE